MADLTEKTLSSEELLRGKLLHVFRDEVRLPDGAVSKREYIVHPGAVMIIPLLDQSGEGLRLIMERQYRYAVRQTIIEFPAGKLDPGEDVLACARRELREETGYTAAEWARAGRLHPVVGYSSEIIEIWFARGLVAGPRSLDKGEMLEVIDVDVPELMDWCRTGRITDSKTLTGAFWVHNVLEGRWALEWQRPQANSENA